MNIEHKNDGRTGEFYIDDESGRIAEIQYFTSAPGQITVSHTEVDEKLRGKGVGEDLIRKTVEYARSRGLKIVPQCPYARKIIERHTELQDVLAES
jgi:uncharacterized protein